MNKRIILAITMIWASNLFSADAFADWRSYVWTYEYMTMRQGAKELEYYLTQQQPDLSQSKPNTWKHYLELEYGISDHWDVALYQRFLQANTKSKSSFEYDGFKIRTRYRLAEKDQLPLDTLVYLEYIRDNESSKPHVLEAKLILAKDIGDFNIAYNQILKQELEADGKTEHEYAAGISYALRPRLKMGIAEKGNETD